MSNKQPISKRVVTLDELGRDAIKSLEQMSSEEREELGRQVDDMMRFKMSATLQYMLDHDGPLTVERFVEINWFGEKTLADLEGEELSEVEEFRDAIGELEQESHSD